MCKDKEEADGREGEMMGGEQRSWEMAKGRGGGREGRKGAERWPGEKEETRKRTMKLKTW